MLLRQLGTNKTAAGILSVFLDGGDLLVAAGLLLAGIVALVLRQPGAQPMNTTLLITGAIAFAGALLLAWLAYRQERRNKKY